MEGTSAEIAAELTLADPMAVETWAAFRDRAGDVIPMLVERVWPGWGDALAAGFLMGGADLAMEAAARCIAAVGAQPHTVLQQDTP